MVKKEKAGPKVLIVDDEEQIVRLVEMVLARQGLTVLKAGNGNDGFKVAQEEMPDAILLDVNMPGMNGIELCSKLKATEKTAQIPVGFLTARREVESYRAAKDVGSLLYIPKPFKPEALINAVGVLLAARGKKM